jgi:hypothetical protein
MISVLYLLRLRPGQGGVSWEYVLHRDISASCARALCRRGVVPWFHGDTYAIGHYSTLVNSRGRFTAHFLNSQTISDSRRLIRIIVVTGK